MKKDLISECNDQRLPEQDFVATFCNRCKNKSCERAGWSSSSWESRISTQAERFLHNPNIVLQSESSRWDDIGDFEVIKQTSVAEVWGAPQRPTPPLFEAPESEPQTEETPPVEEESEEVMELPPKLEVADEEEGRSPTPPVQRLVNTPPQQIYVGGLEPPPAKKETPRTDPWAVPTNKVSVGGTFKMGG
jgi:hypothetical protein